MLDNLPTTNGSFIFLPIHEWLPVFILLRVLCFAQLSICRFTVSPSWAIATSEGLMIERERERKRNSGSGETYTELRVRKIPGCFERDVRGMRGED
jgi:hypothetical protein